MQPEFTAYQNSPHQRVECVQCHIGPGANWLVAGSKGVGTAPSVRAVAFHPSTSTRYRCARVQDLLDRHGETCEQCHWPQVYTGNKLVMIRKFSDDEKNTEQTTVLLLKIGGHTFSGALGIHGQHLRSESAHRIHLHQPAAPEYRSSHLYG